MSTQLVNGVRVSLTPAEEAEILARDIAGVGEYRDEKHRQFQADAFARIAALFGKSDPQALIFAEINDATRGMELLRKESAGTATTPETAELDALQTKKDAVDAIRAAENAASGQLDNAGTTTTDPAATRIAEIDAVVPAWP